MTNRDYTAEIAEIDREEAALTEQISHAAEFQALKVRRMTVLAEQNEAHKQQQKRELEAIAARLRREQKAGTKLAEKQAEAHHAWASAADANEKQNRTIADLVSQYNAVAAQLGEPLQPQSDEPVHSVDRVINGLLGAASLLAAWQTGRSKAKPGARRVLKLCLAVLKGAALSPERFSSMKDYSERMIRHINETKAKREFDAAIDRALLMVKAAQAAYPAVPNWPYASETIPQDTLNQIGAIGNEYISSLNAPQAEPPLIDPAEMEAYARQHSRPIKFGPWA